ncbi:hypothetical protein [Paenibacillus ginsengihumi]|uniref:hypothetical protein n=1 Tax=Paenibacillus ginsengihumi TaxID=431596 RepID=UPI000362BE48|nr:hypothetical protein [Paenibacillus ginsengihumi]
MLERYNFYGVTLELALFMLLFAAGWLAVMLYAYREAGTWKRTGHETEERKRVRS